MAVGDESCHDDSFDSAIFQSKCICCCVASTYTYTYYSTMLGSCHIELFVDMEINQKEFLQSNVAPSVSLSLVRIS